jgi:hypothetical protein
MDEGTWLAIALETVKPSIGQVISARKQLGACGPHQGWQLNLAHKLPCWSDMLV